jgi:hypothetical protein
MSFEGDSHESSWQLYQELAPPQLSAGFYGIGHFRFDWLGRAANSN